MQVGVVWVHPVELLVLRQLQPVSSKGLGGANFMGDAYIGRGAQTWEFIGFISKFDLIYDIEEEGRREYANLGRYRTTDANNASDALQPLQQLLSPPSLLRSWQTGPRTRTTL